jgi:hypothetical protein
MDEKGLFIHLEGLIGSLHQHPPPKKNLKKSP